jgi:hypothetical protein
MLLLPMLFPLWLRASQQVAPALQVRRERQVQLGQARAVQEQDVRPNDLLWPQTSCCSAVLAVPGCGFTLFSACTHMR